MRITETELVVRLPIAVVACALAVTFLSCQAPSEPEVSRSAEPSEISMLARSDEGAVIAAHRNLIRAFHLAGRCTGCDECARVCPADIRLDLINRKLQQVVERRFGYTAGVDPDMAPPLTEFKDDDSEEFIL